MGGSEYSLSNVHPPPKDAFHAAWLIFFLEGVGMLFPWNVFINATDYFSKRFCGTSFEIIYEDSISLSFYLASITGLVFALRYQHLYSIRSRVMWPLWLLGWCFILCCVFVVVDQMDASVLFTVTIGLVLLSGLSIACMQGGLFALATVFPPEYTQALMIGQASAGLAVSLAAILTKLGSPDDSCSSASNSTSTSDSCSEYSTDWSTLVYFLIAVSVLVVTFAMYPVLEKLPFARYCIKQGEVMVASDDPENDVDFKTVIVDEHLEDSKGGWAVVSRGDSDGPEEGCKSLARGASLEAPSFHASASKNLLPVANEGMIGAPEDVEKASARPRGASRNVCTELAAIAPLALTVFLNFTVSLALFPGTTSLIVSWRECLPGYSRFFSKDIFTLFSFLSFNSFDLIGRFTPAVFDPVSDPWLPVAASLRVLFIPLIMGCNTEYSRIPAYLPLDAYPLIIIPLLGWTNGYLVSRVFMAGSRYGPWAVTALGLFLAAGNLFGALLSFFVTYAITGSFT